MTVRIFIRTQANSSAGRAAGNYVYFDCDTAVELPSSDVIDGDRAYAVDTKKRYLRASGAWTVLTTDNLANSWLLSDETVLTAGAVADGQFLKRNGTSLEGAAIAGGGDLLAANNLSDLASASTARTNLGLGTLATQSGTFSGTSSGTNTGDQTSVTGNAGTATALQNARTINGVSFDGTANITVVSPMVIPFHADGSANITMTNQANAEQFLGNSNRNITRADLTNYTQYRLVARVVTGSASANTPRLYAQFHTSFSTTASDYSPLGASGDVNLSLTNAGHVETAWTNLASGAKADVFLTVMQNGGDATADPAVGPVMIQFK